MNQHRRLHPNDQQAKQAALTQYTRDRNRELAENKARSVASCHVRTSRWANKAHSRKSI